MRPNNPMPLIHQARRTRRNRAAGNPFATDEIISRQIETLTDAYLNTSNVRVAALLKVEIDLHEMEI